MGQLVGRGFDPVMRTFYERSLAAGKPKKLGSAAGIRKLLTMPNAAVRTGRYWHPTVVGPYKLTATLSLSSNATALASGAYPPVLSKCQFTFAGTASLDEGQP